MNTVNDFLGFDPFAEAGTFRDALRQLVESGWPVPRDLLPSALASILVPVDVLDGGSDIIVRANMPGVQADSISITISGNILTLKGAIKADPEMESATYLRRERRTTNFMRSLTLPVDVNTEAAHASTSDGVLTLILPKSESVRPKTIRVKTE